MPKFSSRPLNPSPIATTLRRHPFLSFGLPFITLVIASSFALQTFTRTRYDLHDQKVTTMSMEEELGMSAKRKKVDIRDEYYKLNGLGALQQDATLDASSASVEIGRVGGKEGLEGVPAIPSRSRRKAFSMRPVDRDELENVRVPRPPGVPEWGYVPGVEEAPVKGQRKEDRWV